MRILFAANNYLRKWEAVTGFPAYLYRVSQSLISMGHTPVIVAGGKSNGVRMEDGILIYTVECRHINYTDSGLGKIAGYLYCGWLINKKIKQLCKETEIDIIQFTSLSGLAFFYRGKTPAVLRLSCYAKRTYETGQSWSDKTVKLVSLLEVASSRRCNAIFAPSKKTADLYGEDAKRKVSVIESPFLDDVKEYQYDIYNECLAGKKYVLFFGVLRAEKGILLIKKIIKQFLAENQGYYFAFAGKNAKIDGKDAKRILLEAAGEYKERVIFLDALVHEKLYPVIKGADFVVLPYLSDNFPNACIEAMYFGKIVIGIDGSSIEQLIVHKKNGLLCKTANAIELLEKMNTAVCMEQGERKVLEKNAQKRVEQLKPEIVVNRLLKFYQYVILNKR